MTDDETSDDDVTTHDGPVDRLTGLCAEMTTVLDRAENADVKAIVFLRDEERGGIQLHGYDSHGKAMAELFLHMKAVFASMGQELEFIGIPDSPEGLTT